MKNKILSIGALAAALCVPAFAGSFSDNFSSYEAGTQLGSPWFVNYPQSTYPNLSYEITQDTDEFFGQGTDKQYLAISSTGVGTNAQCFLSYYYVPGKPAATSTGQISMSFYDPNTMDKTSTANGLQMRISSNDGAAAGTNTAFCIFLQGGNIYTSVSGGTAINRTILATYDVEQAVELTLVYNNSADAIIYGGDHTLVAGAMDIWLGDTLVYEGVGYYNNYAGSTLGIKNVTFTSSKVFDFYIGEFEMSSDITIPEPAAMAALMGFGLLGVTLIRRRRA